MGLLWYAVSIVIAAVLLAVGLIFGQYWLVAVGFIALPGVAVWGMITSGPGSSYNPYHH